MCEIEGRIKAVIDWLLEYSIKQNYQSILRIEREQVHSPYFIIYTSRILFNLGNHKDEQEIK